MLILEVRKIDCQSLIFSFDAEGREDLESVCDSLLDRIEHMHFVKGSELSEGVVYSSEEYVAYDFLNITHLPEELIKHNLEVEDSYSDQGTGIQLFFNQQGINEFHHMILCAGEKGTVEMNIPHARLERNDVLVSDDCPMTITLQTIDIRHVKKELPKKIVPSVRVKKIPFTIGLILLAVFFLPSAFFGRGGQEQFSAEIGFAAINYYIAFFAFGFLGTAVSFFIVYGLKRRKTGVFPTFVGLFHSDRPVWWVMGVFGYCMAAALAGLVIHSLFLSSGKSMREWLHIADIASFVAGWACACLLCAFVQRKKRN